MLCYAFELHIWAIFIWSQGLVSSEITHNFLPTYGSHLFCTVDYPKKPIESTGASLPLSFWESPAPYGTYFQVVKNLLLCPDKDLIESLQKRFQCSRWTWCHDNAALYELHNSSVYKNFSSILIQGTLHAGPIAKIVQRSTGNKNQPSIPQYMWRQ